MNTIILADDHPVTLKGIQLYVENLGYTVLSTYQNGVDALEGIRQLNPRFVILDLKMPGLNGLEVLEELRKDNPFIKVILYTMYHERLFLTKAMKLGVNGYLLKDFALEELATCLERLQEGENWFTPKLDETVVSKKHDGELDKILSLTPAEKKILSLIAKDHTTKSIAEMLFISDKTVEKHRSNIIRKLGLPNERNILQRFALQNNIFE